MAPSEGEAVKNTTTRVEDQVVVVVGDVSESLDESAGRRHEAEVPEIPEETVEGVHDEGCQEPCEGGTDESGACEGDDVEVRGAEAGGGTDADDGNRDEEDVPVDVPVSDDGELAQTEMVISEVLYELG